MNEKDRRILVKIAEAFYLLPEAKKERFLGYAEGVLDMSQRSAAEAVNAVVKGVESKSDRTA